MAVTLDLYSRAGCHLCEEMKSVLLPIAARLSVRVREIDIAADPALSARYAFDIPVLAHEGRELCRHRVTAVDLERRIRALQRETTS